MVGWVGQNPHRSRVGVWDKESLAVVGMLMSPLFPLMEEYAVVSGRAFTSLLMSVA